MQERLSEIEAKYAELERKMAEPEYYSDAEAYAKLAYFDSKNFAPMVKCPVLFGTGTADIVCPPATQFAVYNNLTCEKRHEFFEGFGHEEIQDFDDLIIPFFCKGGEAHV